MSVKDPRFSRRTWEEADFDDLILQYSIIDRAEKSGVSSLASQPRATLVLEQSESSDSIGGCMSGTFKRVVFIAYLPSDNLVDAL